ncbi:flagellar biosynthesis protein [Natronospira proteinivora]|uniref:Flagellar biosynthetic protein FlhB n=1 Tax=Natronospira proteinivora TaxID=1807133 RepID=A0ABT1G585_9GAMM|nr:EscU/YscU/HrcU family type III secretion system export apparatus switch protein [Natronospira proteinivora]MCP1726464.1 flagellar biosynthesis protein [Natronospira proteinivora]
MSESRHWENEMAVALHYDGNQAPSVSVKGRRKLAREITALAEEYGIPIHQDPDLARFLTRLEVGETIPRELYVAVAEVIAFAYWVSGRDPREEDRWQNDSD